VPRTAVRSGTGTPQVPRIAVRSGTGTPQVPQTAVRSGTEIDLQSIRLSVSQNASIGDFLLAPACPIGEGNSMSGLALFIAGVQNR